MKGRKWMTVLAALCVCMAVLPRADAEKKRSAWLSVGNYVTFGAYPQTASGTDKTPIEWLVLDRIGSSVLLLSRYGLDTQPYHETDASVTWETCTLRKWLNSAFLETAFTPNEWRAINVTRVDNSKQQGDSGWDGVDAAATYDEVFLLSYAEANRYLGVTYENTENLAARAAPTDFAKQRDVGFNTACLTAAGEYASGWWLRSPGYTTEEAALVWIDGSLWGIPVGNDCFCVRPAIWVDTELAMETLTQRPTATPTPRPTATPVPTATPTPIPTATPTPVPTATPSPVPSAAPSPVPSAASSPVPTATPTPVPSAAPSPMPTATPTPRPTATPTPVPTATPSPVPTAEPTLVPTATPVPVAVGDHVWFGAYPQTALGTDKTPIEWLVLDRDGDDVLLLSRYGLDCMPYHDRLEATAWSKCSLRAWLNDEFFYNAFTFEERQGVLSAFVDNGAAQGCAGWLTSGGQNTIDRVFLLSYAEANRYFGLTYSDGNASSRAAPTDYALTRGAYAAEDCTTGDGAHAGFWWLRSPGYAYQSRAAGVYHDGTLDFDTVTYNRACVRPAIWVNLSAGGF